MLFHPIRAVNVCWICWLCYPQRLGSLQNHWVSQISAMVAAASDAMADYQDPNLIGLRTQDAMYRFFGRRATATGYAGARDVGAPEGCRRAWQASP